MVHPMNGDTDCSCKAKLARVVLEERGPLSPEEVADEAHLSRSEAESALAELVDDGKAEPVCGVAETGEEVFALSEKARGT